MANLKYASLTVLLFLVPYSLVPADEESSVAEIQDSLVIVYTRTTKAIGVGNGFVIGDGTLVVTAHHGVFESSKKGNHRAPGLVSVLSPYLGDACDAEILASDKELDLAILRTPWKGHPSLVLADDQSFLSAEHLVVAGLRAVIKGPSLDIDEPRPEWAEVQSKDFPVNFVGVRKGLPRFIRLAEVEGVGVGWSGSPLLVPGTSLAAGCYTKTIVSGPGEEMNFVKSIEAEGPASTQIRSLLKNANEEKCLEGSEQAIARPKGAADALLVCLQAVLFSVRKQYPSALDKARAFIHLRPQSAFGYRLAASAAEKLGQYDLAEEFYQKGLGLEPEGRSIRILYAQLLAEQGSGDEAFALLEKVWQSGNSKEQAAHGLYRILSERGEFASCVQMMKEALKDTPQNAHLWVYLGQCQEGLKDYDAAASSLDRAVQLLPDLGFIRLVLAQALEKAGKSDEAEKNFRESVKTEPQNPHMHFMLATFLARHRPEARKEALEHAETALRLPPARGLSKQMIENFIRSLHSETGADKEVPR
jgi:tetratricopeptide (TPR) repeat protein